MESVDLLVIGAGMAGLTAGARAARSGLSVTVTEIGSEIGGSGRFAGYAWTAPTVEVMDENNPDGDPALKRALVTTFDAVIDWIRETGVEPGPAQRILPFGRGRQFDTTAYINSCKRIIRDGGGQLLLRTQTSGLLVEDGAVVGAHLTLADGTPRLVRANRTLIATGGFQGDPELLKQLVHPGAATMPLRSNPHSRGDGYRLATAVGAATGPENGGFYGHLVPSGIPFADPADFVDLSLYYSEHALLFNVAGERFCDETLGDHLTAIALSEQPAGRGLLIADARVHRDWVVGSYVDGAIAVDKFALASKRGGRVGLAESLEELDDLPDDWGYDGPTIRAAIERFNDVVRTGGVPSPGRRLDRSPLDEPPYYVIEAVPAITFTFHGIRINDRAEVLRPDGAPIQGLLCAGADSGGLWNRAYAGGVAAALAFGLIAARSATDARDAAPVP
jgi:succinate dehydrogenase/fumarate reductase flavoprotein subunit